MQTVGLVEAPRRADPYSDSKSLEFGFRARRFAKVKALIDAVLREQRECEIIDLGGTETYWDIGGDYIRSLTGRLKIHLLNTEPVAVARPAMFSYLRGSATEPNLFGSRRFDIVHSNSVVEHVGDWSDMQRFAQNVRRLAPRYYCQTPNYWFAFEPHFRTVGFQYLPRAARIALLRRFPLGFFRAVPDRAEAEDIIDHHRLLSTRQMRKLFPDADVTHEVVYGLNKSILATRDR